MIVTYDSAVAPPLAQALIEAVNFAGDQLSALVDCPLQLRGTHVERLRLEDLPGLRSDEDRLVTAIHLEFEGPFEGHVVLSFSPDAAAQLASKLLMEEVNPDEPLDEMARSALGEVGNITTAAFLTSVANAVHYTVHPSPPTIIHDMIGALLSNIVLELALQSTNYGLVVHTTIEIGGETLCGELILLPTNHSSEALESRLSQCNPQPLP